jgi:hypothetical protein
MITENEYKEAQRIIKLYESQLNIRISRGESHICNGCNNQFLDCDDYPCNCCRDGSKKEINTDLR